MFLSPHRPEGLWGHSLLRSEDIASLARVIIAANAHIFAINYTVTAGDKYGGAATQVPDTLSGVVEIQLLLRNHVCAVPRYRLRERKEFNC